MGHSALIGHASAEHVLAHLPESGTKANREVFKLIVESSLKHI